VRAPVLSPPALGRASLARQLLLRREAIGALEAVERLVGLQAQEPRDPYVGLWSRLERFRPEALEALLEERRVVRTVVMRGTIHLVGAGDCMLLRPLVQPVLDAELARHRDHAPALAGMDLEPVLAAARELFEERPRTGPELGTALAARFPGRDPGALAYACRCRLPLVQVPPRGLWRRTGRVTTTTAQAWLGRPLAAAPSIDEVVLRYLGAFGPATAADVSAWSGLAGMREVIDRLRPRLRAFRDEAGRELVDLPDAPRPDPDAPAPVRFLPRYDNALLSHADRSRVVADRDRARLAGVAGTVDGSVLHDGRLRAVWRLERDRRAGAAALVVHHVPLARRAAGSVAAEGRRLLRLIAADADPDRREVRLAPLP
jgi:hypothetical protein